jgi:hypothetical protein
MRMYVCMCICLFKIPVNTEEDVLTVFETAYMHMYVCMYIC